MALIPSHIQNFFGFNELQTTACRVADVLFPVNQKKVILLGSGNLMRSLFLFNSIFIKSSGIYFV